VLEQLHTYFKITSDDDARTRREKVNGRIVTLDRALEDTRPYLFALLDCEHLRRVLKVYALYYNRLRTHLSLDKDAPECRRVQRVGNVAALPVLGGLHHHYTLEITQRFLSISKHSTGFGGPSV
jgi:hypothetical protein